MAEQTVKEALASAKKVLVGLGEEWKWKREAAEAAETAGVAGICLKPLLFGGAQERGMRPLTAGRPSWPLMKGYMSGSRIRIILS